MVSTYKHKKIPLINAKPMVVAALEEGCSLEKAFERVGRWRQSYYKWCNDDPSFKTACQIAMAKGKGLTSRNAMVEAVGSFSHFRHEYLRTGTFTHQHQWIDVIEGREPRDLHESIKYEKGDPRYLLINCPPEHSKTITMSVHYPVYRLCMDPSTRILLVSKTAEMAKQFLYAIKQILTHPSYKRLQAAFAPAGEFKGEGSIWQASRVYLGNAAREPGEKDPSIACLGLGGQIYGARADLIILDDTVVLSNANQYESQIRWIQQEVITRLGPGGRLIVCGTRVDSLDLYGELRNGERYPDGKSPWTYLAQPAVLEFAEKPEDWKTLWPKSDLPWAGLDELPDDNGLFDRWDGRRMHARRGVLDARTWSMVYQQQDVSDDAVFPIQTVRKCVNGGRTVGPLSKNNNNHRKKGMDGLYVICSMDPAMAGQTASIVYAADPEDGKRYVLDAHLMHGPTPRQIREVIRDWTEKYEPNCWVIEKNAFQLFLTRDEEIRTYLANKGVSMVEHYTGSQNKLDPDFGVASLAPLFEEQLIELPSTHNSEGCKNLVEQLVTWRPGVKGKDLKQDLPLALWFAELKVRNILESRAMGSSSHLKSRYLPGYRRKKQNIVYLDEYERSTA